MMCKSTSVRQWLTVLTTLFLTVVLVFAGPVGVSAQDDTDTGAVPEVTADAVLPDLPDVEEHVLPEVPVPAPAPVPEAEPDLLPEDPFTVDLEVPAVLDPAIPTAPVVPLAVPSPEGFWRDGSYWEDMAVSPNPPAPTGGETCRPGNLSIALVFDLSNSIGATGLRRSKEAGHGVIDSLAGMATSVGIFNFSTNSPATDNDQYPSFNLLDDAQASAARAAVDGLSMGADPGGTNWEGALKDVAEAAPHYDLVYLITDGMPTTNEAQAPVTVPDE